MGDDAQRQRYEQKGVRQTQGECTIPLRYRTSSQLRRKSMGTGDAIAAAQQHHIYVRGVPHRGLLPWPVLIQLQFPKHMNSHVDSMKKITRFLANAEDYKDP